MARGLTGSAPAAVRADALREAPVAIFDNYWGANLSFLASLGRRRVPLKLYGRGAGRWSRYATSSAACPPVEDAERFLPWLEQRIRSGEIGRVAPTTDLITYYTSLLRDRFAPAVQRSIAPLSEIETCLIKTRFATACAHVGQGTPATHVPADMDSALRAAEEIGFPVILKPKAHLAIGTVERGTIVRSAAELRETFGPYATVPGQEFLLARYPELRWPLLQRYVPTARTRVFSVSGFKDPDGGVIAASLSCKRAQWPPDTGTSTSQVSWRDERILQAGLGTIDKLISRGLFELELLSSGDELLAIDLNPRAFGFLALDMALGKDLPWLWFQSTLAPLHPGPAAGKAPIIEARLSVPYWINRCVRALLGPADDSDEELGRQGCRVEKRVSLVGHWDDPIPLMLRGAWLLRHPRALVRPFIKATMRADVEPPVEPIG